MKLLLYCTKSPKQLFYDKVADKYMYGLNSKNDKFNSVNGKIIAECDFKVETIKYQDVENYTYDEILPLDEILEKSCLTKIELEDYLKGKNGYAIHIKNLNILENPVELNEVYKKYGDIYNVCYMPLMNAPQNMMYAYAKYGGKYVLISIRPEWLCKILNGEKTIEVRKKVLKEML